MLRRGPWTCLAMYYVRSNPSPCATKHSVALGHGRTWCRRSGSRTSSLDLVRCHYFAQLDLCLACEPRCGE
jgi:hypothetical protein